MAYDISLFSLEGQQEQQQKHKAALERRKEKRQQDSAFYRKLFARIRPAEYGADSKWDCVFGEFSVYVDGMGLCVTTRGRWKDYQGREVVHWGVYKINPFVQNDDELRSEYYEIPTDGFVGDIQRRWVLPIPFTLLQFRLDEKRRGASELVFCRAKDYDDDEFERKVMRLDDFLRQVKADKNHDKGYRVLLDALRMQYPKEVEKYMVLEKRLHGSSEGPARVTHKNDDDGDSETDSETDNSVTDLNSVDKRIGWCMGMDDEMDFVRYRMARFIENNSSACKIIGIGKCDARLPHIPHAREQRLTALSVEQSRTAKIIANGGDPSTGRELRLSIFDV